MMIPTVDQLKTKLIPRLKNYFDTLNSDGGPSYQFTQEDVDKVFSDSDMVLSGGFSTADVDRVFED